MNLLATALCFVTLLVAFCLMVYIFTHQSQFHALYMTFKIFIYVSPLNHYKILVPFPLPTSSCHLEYENLPI